MTERVPEIGLALDRLAPPLANIAGDWEAVLRESRRSRAAVVALVIGTLAILFGVAPALGVGRDVLWLGLYEDPQPLIELASGNSYAVGPWRVGVSGGGEGSIALDLVYRGERKIVAGGVDAGLPGGRTPGDGRHWVGYVTFKADGQFAFGPAAARVNRVDVRLEDGRTFHAEIVPAPPEVRTPLRFYIAEVPFTANIQSIRAFDDSGVLLEERAVFR